MHIMVHVKDKAVAVSCGDGHQPVKWLANVGMARYDDAQGRSLGTPAAVKLENGTPLTLTSTLTDAGLSDLQHVYVVFKPHQSPAQKGGKKGAMAAADEVD